MKRRCPGARALGPAALSGYRFFVGIDGWGSVATSAGDTVHGVLWRLTPRDMAALHASFWGCGDELDVVPVMHRYLELSPWMAEAEAATAMERATMTERGP